MTSITTACFPCTITFWTQPIYAFGFIPETLTLFFPLRERWIGSPALAAQSSRNGNHGQVNPPTPSAFVICASHFSSLQTFETSSFLVSYWQAAWWLCSGIWPNDLCHCSWSWPPRARGAPLACTRPFVYFFDWGKFGQLSMFWVCFVVCVFRLCKVLLFMLVNLTS